MAAQSPIQKQFIEKLHEIVQTLGGVNNVKSTTKNIYVKLVNQIAKRFILEENVEKRVTILTEFESFSKHLFDTPDVNLGELQVVFLSIALFIELVHKEFDLLQLSKAFTILAYLDFCSPSLRMELYMRYNMVLELLFLKYTDLKVDKKFITYAIEDILKPIGFDLYSVNHVEDKQTLMLAGYFLTLVEISMLFKMDETFYPDIEDKILTMCFKLVICSDKYGKHANLKAHIVLIQLIKAKKYIQIIPYYLKLLFEGFPDASNAASIGVSLNTIFSCIEEKSPLYLYTLNMLEEKIKNVHDPFQSTMLLFVSFNLIGSVGLLFLDELLENIRRNLHKLEYEQKKKMCEMLYESISNNHDYRRKDKLVRWYINLLKELEIKSKL